MRTCTICGCSSYLLSSTFNPFAPDAKLSRVEHTLDLLIKSRHGNHRYAKKLGSQFPTTRDVVPEMIPDLYPPPKWIPLARKFIQYLSGKLQGLTSVAITSTGVASIPAYRRSKTAYALNFTQLANSRGL